MRVIYNVFVMCIFVFSLPMQIGIGMFVLLTSGFPVLFSQKRVGKDGKPFLLYKFRTMIPGAQRMQKKLQCLNEANGPVFKIHNDPRYTSIGKTLAHTGLDELPQLYNILLGDMALLGPRPLPRAEEQKLKPWQKAREQIKPGIFSPWILEGYHWTKFDAWMKSDIAYMKEKSFWYDLRLFFRMIAYMGFLIGHEIVRVV